MNMEKCAMFAKNIDKRMDGIGLVVYFTTQTVWFLIHFSSLFIFQDQWAKSMYFPLNFKMKEIV